MLRVLGDPKGNGMLETDEAGTPLGWYMSHSASSNAPRPV